MTSAGAIALLLLMAGYAFALRPVGFIASTILFLTLGPPPFWGNAE